MADNPRQSAATGLVRSSLYVSIHQWRHWKHKNAQLTISQEYFKNDTMALIGYGSQGHGQGLNLRDNGLNVIVGVRKDGASWKEAVQDGWQPGVNLFEIDEAVQKGTIVMNLLSDAAQKETWSHLKPMLTKGKVSQEFLIRRFCAQSISNYKN